MQRRRVISIILVILLAMTSIPSFAFAEGEGGSNVVMGYYDENGQWQQGELTQTLPDGINSVNKTAVQDPNNPNEYDVTLEVVTTQTTTTTLPGSAATVLVIDTSGSMEGTRIASAKAAAVDFVNTYSGDTAGTGRYLAVVSFNTRVSTTLSWIDVSTTSGKTAAINAINGLTANGGTNLHAGLKVADVLLGENIVSAVPTAQKNVVALTDGAPTFYLSACPGNLLFHSHGEGTITIEGERYDIYGRGSAGSSATNNATAAEAASLRTAANVFTVCYGAADDYTYSGGPKVGDFLKNSIASSTANAYNADNAAQLSAAFEAISETIVSGLDGSGMTVDDTPVDFVTVSGLPEGIQLGGDGFTWALNNPVIETIGNTTYYRYTLTYTITLDADSTEFEEGAWYPLNGDTELNIPNEDGTTTTVKFPIPAGQGTKTDYSVTYKPGTHGIFEEVTTGELHIGDNTPEAPQTLGGEGWEFAGWSPVLTPTVTGNATYTAQWKEDYTITKDLSYTVEHWVEGEVAARDTETVSETVWINDPDTLTIQDITLKNYTGYKYGSNDAGLAEGTGILVGAGTIGKDGVIKVTYVKDDTQEKELSYTVEHWIEGETAARETETVKEEVWVNDPDTLTIKNITLKNYTGYKYGSNDAGLTEGTGILVGAGTIADKGIIKVTYVRDDDQKKELSYTAEHWVEGETAARETETVKEEVWVNEPDTLTIKDITLKNYTGYKYGSNDAGLTEGTGILVGTGTIADKGIIKVTYIRDDDQKKELSYTVEHWVEGETAARDTETVSETVWVNEPDTLTIQDITLKDYTGYMYGSNDAGLAEGTGILVGAGTIADKGIIKVTYIRDDDQKKELNYTVEHWVKGETAARETEIVKEEVWVNDPDTLTIKDITLKNYTGYKYGSNDAGLTEGTGILVGAGTIADKGIIKVTYIRDDDQKKELSYTVEHWVEGETAARETETVKEEVWVNDPDTLTIQDIILKAYTGYKYGSNDAGLTAGALKLIGQGTIADKGIIKVIYVTDDSQTKDLSYTVEYYKDEVKAEEETITENVWINATVMPVNFTVNANKYVGYKFDSTDPETIPATIADGGVIKVYYVTDDSQTKDLSYTVEYYKDEVKAEEETITENVWINATVMPVNFTVNANKYVGYKFDSTDPETIPATIADGGVIKVYYVTDDSQTKDLSYTVEYYKDEVKAEEETITENVWINATVMPVNFTVNANKYVGYKFDSTDPETIPATIADGGVIKVYYVTDDSQTKDLSYTVEYYKDEVKAEEETITENVWINATVMPVNFTVNANKYVGYKFDSTDPETIPATIADGGVIKVYYVTDDSQTKDLSYTVEYYKDEVKAEEETITENVWINATVMPVNFTVNANKYVGYKFDSTDPETIPATIADGGVIKVYYVTDDSQTKDLSYTVEYYKDEVKAEEETITENVWINATVMPVNFTVNANKYVGYKFDSTDPETIPATIADGGVIKVYYVTDGSQTKDLSYTVEYYKDEVKAEEETITENVWINATVMPVNFTVNANKYVGYKFDSTDPETIPATIADGGVIKVYYVTDGSQTKDLSYTVEYYKDEVKAEEETITENVWINATVMPVNFTVNANKYVGYKFDSTDPETIPATIADGGVIKVYYVTDDSQTKDLSYTVEYYKDEVKAEEETITENVWINATVMPVNFTVNANKYVGYKFDSTDPETIPATIADGGVIKVYYVTDDSQTKDLSYTVEYYKDEVKAEEETITENVWINATVMPVNFTVNANKYVGYKFDSTDPETIPATIADGGVIKVYYVTDGSQTKDLSYTVEYYKDEVKAEEETITENVWINATVMPVNFTVNANKYVGYKFDSTDPETIPATIADGGVIKVYYVTDDSQTKELSYTVEYYKDEVKAEEETITENVWINATVMPVNFTVNANKYVGYKFDSTDPETIPATIADGGVIKVYYVTDDSQTKDLSYTVEYYKDEVKVEEETITENVWINATVMPVNFTVNANKYVGYKFDSTDPETIPATIADGGVIKVYYVTDDSQTKDLSYTVEYYKDEVKVEEETITENVWINATVMPVNFTVNTNKYVGYKFDSTDPETIPATISDGGVIKVYYVTDDSQTKELSYTVEHWVEGEDVARDTEIITETVWVNEEDTLSIQDILLKAYPGCSYIANDASLEQTEGKLVGEGTIANKGNIKVTYAKEKYIVTYTDGMEGKAFADQVYESLEYGMTTPKFEGTPELKWYKFIGWKPEVAETVTGNAIYVAQWEEVGEEEPIDEPPKPEPPKPEPPKPEPPKPEPPKPNPIIPYTGVETNEGTWLLLMAIGALGYLIASKARKKEEK